MGGITARGGSQSVEPYIPQINRALQTLQGWAFTTSVDSQVLASDVQAVQGLLAAGGGRGAFNLNSPDYTTTIAELSEYVNQYGIHNPPLTTFLQGGAVQIGTGDAPYTARSDGTLSLDDLNGHFMAHTLFFMDNQNNYSRFLNDAAAAGRAATQGLDPDNGPNTVSVKQIAGNGTVTTDERQALLVQNS